MDSARQKLIVQQLLILLTKFQKAEVTHCSDGDQHRVGGGQLSTKILDTLGKLFTLGVPTSQALSILLSESIRCECNMATQVILDHCSDKLKLTNQQAVVNAPHGNGAFSCLHEACIHRASAHTVQRLIDLGANPWLQTSKGSLPIHFTFDQLHQLKINVDNNSADQSLLNIYETSKTLVDHMKRNTSTDSATSFKPVYCKMLELNDIKLVQIFHDAQVKFDWNGCMQALEHALQNFVDTVIIESLLNEICDSWMTSGNGDLSAMPQSPVDLCLRYNHIPATQAAIKLGE